MVVVVVVVFVVVEKNSHFRNVISCSSLTSSKVQERDLSSGDYEVEYKSDESINYFCHE